MQRQQHSFFSQSNVSSNNHEDNSFDEELMDIEGVSPDVINKLRDKNLTIGSIKNLKLSELSRLIGEDMNVCHTIMKYVKGESTSIMRNKLNQSQVNFSQNNNNQSPFKASLTQQQGSSFINNTLALFEKETNPSNYIKTFCQGLDNALGGSGIKTGVITDICGVPGVGKTQLALQLAIDVQMPTAFDGIEGECIYIDTEGSFTAERTKEIAEHFISHLNGIANKWGDSDLTKKEKMLQSLENFTVEKILSSIHYYRIMSLWELIGLILVISELLKQEQYSKVKLIIIDSIAFHLRKSSLESDNKIKEDVKRSLGVKLKEIAQEFNLAVVTTNQVTTKFSKQTDEYGHTKQVQYFAPSLNQPWLSQVTFGIFLEFSGNNRIARITKGINGKDEAIRFKITPSGFRGESMGTRTATSGSGSRAALQLATNNEQDSQPSNIQQETSKYTEDMDENKKRKRK
ncbi:hypothetical protein ABK040_005336 [Willaertia magna]